MKKRKRTIINFITFFISGDGWVVSTIYWLHNSALWWWLSLTQLQSQSVTTSSGSHHLNFASFSHLPTSQIIGAIIAGVVASPSTWTWVTWSPRAQRLCILWLVSTYLPGLFDSPKTEKEINRKAPARYGLYSTHVNWNPSRKRADYNENHINIKISLAFFVIAALHFALFLRWEPRAFFIGWTKYEWLAEDERSQNTYNASCFDLRLCYDIWPRCDGSQKFASHCSQPSEPRTTQRLRCSADNDEVSRRRWISLTWWRSSQRWWWWCPNNEKGMWPTDKWSKLNCRRESKSTPQFKPIRPRLRQQRKDCWMALGDYRVMWNAWRLGRDSFGALLSRNYK